LTVWLAQAQASTRGPVPALNTLVRGINDDPSIGADRLLFSFPRSFGVK